MDFTKRLNEINYLRSRLGSNQAELVLVYGRRRVGKTVLVNEIGKSFGAQFFEFIGSKDLPKQDQIFNAMGVLKDSALAEEALSDDKLKKHKLSLSRTPKNWRDFFQLLTILVQSCSKDSLIFIDELPWFCTPRSKFLQYFDYFWNRYWCKDRRFKIVVCGSATSWLLEKFLGDKAGLHNRITGRLHLQAFDLRTTAEYLKSRGIVYSKRQLVELYLCFGGIPYYLNNAQINQTPTLLINEFLNNRTSFLNTEFNILMEALFRKTTDHKKILHTLNKSFYSVPRQELSKTSGISEGEHFTNLLNELTACGIIHKYIPFGQRERNAYYRLVDEYIRFYYKWVQGKTSENFAGKSDYWLTLTTSSEYLAWAGYGFETICQKEVNSILAAMGISGMRVEVSNYLDAATHTQIDLVLDRSDDQINLCEIKYTQAPFVIDKNLLAKLAKKEFEFRKKTKTSKAISWILITSAGLANNKENDFFAKVITLEDLV